MRKLSQYFLRGLLTLLPFGLTVYVFFKFLSLFEQMSAPAIRAVVGEHYVPGMGFLLGVAVVCLLGFFVSRKLLNPLFMLVEVPFKNVPIVKSIYSAAKNLADYFSGEGERSAQVVIVKWPGIDVEMIGFLTRPDLNDMPKEFTKDDRVGVYFPMSYQIGGYTAFIPRAWISKTDIPVEVAMRSALTAWMPGRE